METKQKIYLNVSKVNPRLVREAAAPRQTTLLFLLAQIIWGRKKVKGKKLIYRGRAYFVFLSRRIYP